MAGAFAWLGGVKGALRFERGMSPRIVVGLIVVGVAGVYMLLRRAWPSGPRRERTVPAARD